jgi:hypothetical protein
MSHASAATASLLDDFREPGTSYLSPHRIAEFLGWQLQGVAERAKVGRNTPAARPQNEVLQQYLRDVLRVLTAAEDSNGDRIRAVYWFVNAPLSEFEYRTPEQLVQEGRTQAVIDYIESVSSGATG